MCVCVCVCVCVCGGEISVFVSKTKHLVGNWCVSYAPLRTIKPWNKTFVYIPNAD